MAGRLVCIGSSRHIVRSVRTSSVEERESVGSQRGRTRLCTRCPACGPCHCQQQTHPGSLEASGGGPAAVPSESCSKYKLRSPGLPRAPEQARVHGVPTLPLRLLTLLSVLRGSETVLPRERPSWLRLGVNGGGIRKRRLWSA